jgi:hypothetical protein
VRGVVYRVCVWICGIAWHKEFRQLSGIFLYHMGLYVCIQSRERTIVCVTVTQAFLHAPGTPSVDSSPARETLVARMRITIPKMHII